MAVPQASAATECARTRWARTSAYAMTDMHSPLLSHIVRISTSVLRMLTVASMIVSTHLAHIIVNVGKYSIGLSDAV